MWGVNFVASPPLLLHTKQSLILNTVILCCSKWKIFSHSFRAVLEFTDVALPLFLYSLFHHNPLLHLNLTFYSDDETIQGLTCLHVHEKKGHACSSSLIHRSVITVDSPVSVTRLLVFVYSDCITSLHLSFISSGTSNMKVCFLL